MTRQSEERNQQYQETNEFFDQVAQLIAELSSNGAIAVKASDILTYGLGIPVERHKANRHDRKVAQALEKLGLVKKRIGQFFYVTPDASELHQVFPADITSAVEKLRSCPKRSEGTLVVEPDVATPMPTELPADDPVTELATPIAEPVVTHLLPQHDPDVKPVDDEDDPF
ncbi:hypothetical protein [Microseira sp. BLCC-F43]|jgi:hypothetical protein|uniref:hypothetical protein n=1 Tax=Microseira sp. BLCC-F43 TaxID=3153602 RepID=UPI0035BB6C03